MGHVLPVRVYLTVFAILLVLTAVTTTVAFVDLGRGNTIVMLTIAVTKATLVVLYFMHVRWSPPLTRLVLAAAFAWLALLITGATIDVVLRGVPLLR